jgi:TolA-binding protein
MNKLKLFYISMIVMLIVGIVKAVGHIKQVEKEQDRGAKIQNSAIQNMNKCYLQAQEESDNYEDLYREASEQIKTLEDKIEELQKKHLTDK